MKKNILLNLLQFNSWIDFDFDEYANFIRLNEDVRLSDFVSKGTSIREAEAQAQSRKNRFW